MKFLVVDDHPLVREALAALLQQLRPDATVLQAATGAQALTALSEAPQIDLILLDLRLPDGSGIALLKRIGETSLGTAVVVLSGDLDQPTVRQALAAGAVGCIPKSEQREVIARALELVLAGGVYVPPMALHPALDGSDALPNVPGAATSVRGGPVPVARQPGRTPTPGELGLTVRQLDVLALLMQGKNNKLICRALGLAEPTVKNHVSAILRALDVDSRTEAVLQVTRLGWVMPNPGPPH